MRAVTVYSMPDSAMDRIMKCKEVSCLNAHGTISGRERLIRHSLRKRSTSCSELEKGKNEISILPTGCHNMMGETECPESNEPPVVLVHSTTNGLNLQPFACTGGICQPQDKGWHNNSPILSIHNEGSVNENEIAHSRLAKNLNRLRRGVIRLGLSCRHAVQRTLTMLIQYVESL